MILFLALFMWLLDGSSLSESPNTMDLIMCVWWPGDGQDDGYTGVWLLVLPGFTVDPAIFLLFCGLSAPC